MQWQPRTARVIPFWNAAERLPLAATLGRFSRACTVRTPNSLAQGLNPSIVTHQCRVWFTNASRDSPAARSPLLAPRVALRNAYRLLAGDGANENTMLLRKACDIFWNSTQKIPSLYQSPTGTNRRCVALARFFEPRWSTRRSVQLFTEILVTITNNRSRVCRDDDTRNRFAVGISAAAHLLAPFAFVTLQPVAFAFTTRKQSVSSGVVGWQWLCSLLIFLSCLFISAGDIALFAFVFFCFFYTRIL